MLIHISASLINAVLFDIRYEDLNRLARDDLNKVDKDNAK